MVDIYIIIIMYRELTPGSLQFMLTPLIYTVARSPR